ncbi:GerW family sporulation protein [Clostridium frigidicarnis]|uniref:Sporulation protein YtfJ n=1 Tax=Clostridium frigidicarnis TaxID=84698 RepID=A0A1I0WF64_9CLOT|nr:GerW family sporulation protein [Clostridium frigidicarnis]SFA87372.1 sporulation protein YtfJ [Clostridium frigidicarnis]
MENHPIENLMKCTMENIKDMIDVNTIVGEPVVTGEGTTIVPISKVSFGFASGGSEFLTKHNSSNNLGNLKVPFGGGSGAGVTVKPVGFLVIGKDSIRMLSVDADNTYDKIVDSVPQVIDMVSSIFNKNAKEKEQ